MVGEGAFISLKEWSKTSFWVLLCAGNLFFMDKFKLLIWNPFFVSTVLREWNYDRTASYCCIMTLIDFLSIIADGNCSRFYFCTSAFTAYSVLLACMMFIISSIGLFLIFLRNKIDVNSPLAPWTNNSYCMLFKVNNEINDELKS